MHIYLENIRTRPTSAIIVTHFQPKFNTLQ